MSNQIGVLFLPQISALAARQPVFALFWAFGVKSSQNERLEQGLVRKM